MDQILGVGWHQLLQEFVVLLLVLECHPEVFLQIIGVCNSLVALHHLEVSVSIEGNVAVETVSEAFYGSTKLVTVLVHQAQVEDHGGRVWVLVSTDHLQDAPGPVQVLEALRPVPALVIVEAQV